MDIEYSNMLHYIGKVEISVINNDTHKVVSTKVIKNTGRYPLFYFMTQCLAGNYKDFNSQRPSYIRLFTIGDDGADIPNDKSIETTKLIVANLCSQNAFYVNDASVTDITKAFNTDNTSNQSATVTFSFMCPYTQLDTTKPINLIALYSRANKDTLAEPSAYFVVKSDNKLGSLIDSSTSDKNNYTLSIKWNLTIKN